jgi:hypothetical protein
MDITAVIELTGNRQIWEFLSVKRWEDQPAAALAVVGYTVKNFESWEMPFYLLAAVFAFDVAMWLWIDPRRLALDA